MRIHDSFYYFIVKMWEYYIKAHMETLDSSSAAQGERVSQWIDESMEEITKACWYSKA